MADIINIFNKEDTSTSTELKNPLSVSLLEIFNREADNLQDIIILYKHESGTIGIYDTDPSIEDKALMAGMLQHQLTKYFNSNRVPVDPNSIFTV